MAPLCACACAAFAQGSTIQISSPSPDVVLGNQVRLTATFLNAAGDVVNGKTIQWISDDPGILAVDQDGSVTGLSLGIGGIIAFNAEDNVFGFIQLQVLPSRIEVMPARVDLGIGDQQRFSAVAYDAHGNPIPDTTFYWQLTGPNGYDTDVATIDPTGLLRAHTWGSVTVHAIIEYEAFFRFAGQVEARAAVNVRQERPYQLSRLLSSSDVVSAQRLRPTFGTGFGANDAGQIALVASLDGMAAGPMLYDNGVFKLLTSGGRSTPIPGGVIGPFGTPAVNRDGDVLSSIGGWGHPAGLMLSTPEGSSYVVLEDTRFSSVGTISDFETTKESLNDSDEMAFSAYYYIPGTDIEGSALLKQSGSTQRVIRTTNQTLAGLGDVVWFQDFGVDNDGWVHFLAGSDQGIGLYKGDGTAEPERVLGVGDALAGSQVDWMWDLVVALGGDVALGASLADGPVQLVRVRQGAITTLGLDELFRVFSVSNAGVIFVGDAGQGVGLFRWDGKTVIAAVPGEQLQNLLATYGAVTGVEDSVITPGGRVFTQLRTERSSQVLVESGPAPGVVLQADDPVPVQANLFLHPDSLVPNTGGGAPQLLLSRPGSLFSAGTGGPIPRLVTGDRLPDGQAFRGADGGVVNGAGDVYFYVRNSGIHRHGHGMTEVVVPSRVEIDGEVIVPAEPFAVNERGDVAFTASTQGEAVRLYLLESGHYDLLAYRGEDAPLSAAASGAILAFWADLAVDGQGRVMALMFTADERIGFFLYSGGRWEETAVFGESQLNGLTLEGGFRLRSVGNRFYAIWSLPPDFALVEFRNGAWHTMVASRDALPQGESMQRYFTGHYDVNREGDVAYTVAAGGVEFLALRSGNQVQIVHSTRVTDQPELLLRALGPLDLRDDGRIYFTGFGVLDDDFGLYQALPQGSNTSRFLPRSRAKIGR